MATCNYENLSRLQNYRGVKTGNPYILAFDFRFSYRAPVGTEIPY